MGEYNIINKYQFWIQCSLNVNKHVYAKGICGNKIIEAKITTTLYFFKAFFFFFLICTYRVIFTNLLAQLNTRVIQIQVSCKQSSKYNIIHAQTFPIQDSKT